MKKRFTALLCSACMAFTGVYAALPEAPMTASSADIVDSGRCGQNLTWKLDDEGLLTIEGTGKMTGSQWSVNNSKKIQKVVISQGVTTIDRIAFRDLTNLSEISIPESVVSVGERAFYGCSSLEEITFPLNCSSIGRCAMGNCAKLRKVTILNSDISILGQWSAGDLQEEYPHFGISNNKLLFVRDESIEELTKFIPKEPAFFNGTIYSYPNSRMKEWAEDYCEFQALDTAGLLTIKFDPQVEEGEMRTLYAEKGYIFTLPEFNLKVPNRKEFSGWEIDGKLYQSGDKITVEKSLTLKAVWEVAKAPGDVNGDQKVDAKDASFILGEYAKLSTGGKSTLTNATFTAADVKTDGKIDAKDATVILSYYSYRSTGGTGNLSYFLNHVYKTPEDK